MHSPVVSNCKPCLIYSITEKYDQTNIYPNMTKQISIPIDWHDFISHSNIKQHKIISQSITGCNFHTSSYLHNNAIVRCTHDLLRLRLVIKRGVSVTSQWFTYYCLWLSQCDRYSFLMTSTEIFKSACASYNSVII